MTTSFKLGFNSAPEKCPVCHKHFRDLAKHLNVNHSLKFTGTITPDGMGLHLTSIPDQTSSTRNQTDPVMTADGAGRRALTGGAGPGRIHNLKGGGPGSGRSTLSNISQAVSSTNTNQMSNASVNLIQNSSIIVPKRASSRVPPIQTGLTPAITGSSQSLSNSRNSGNQRPLASSLNPNVMHFVPMQLKPSSLSISQDDSDSETARSSIFGNNSTFDDYESIGPALDMIDLSASFEEVYDDHSIQLDIPTISPVNSLFDSTLARHSTPLSHRPPFQNSFVPGVSTASPNSASLSTPNVRSDSNKSDDQSLRDLKDVFVTHGTLSGLPCNANGIILPANHPANKLDSPAEMDWSPFKNRPQYEFSDLVCRQNVMSPNIVNRLLKFYRLSKDRNNPSQQIPFLFKNHNEILETIDSSTIRETSWFSSTFGFNNNTSDGLPKSPEASWMLQKVDISHRSPYELLIWMLGNKSFAKDFDAAPYRRYNNARVRQYDDFFSGDWVWREADKIVNMKIEGINGAMIVPIILCLDKLAFSIGQFDYFAVFMSIGNFTNGARRSLTEGVVLLGFIGSPKPDGGVVDEAFSNCRSQLWHRCISCMLAPLKDIMTKPEVLMCPDGHYRRVICSIGLHIAKYPEQVQLGGTRYGWCFCCPLSPTSPKFGDVERTDAVNFRSCEQTEALVMANEDATLVSLGVIKETIPYTNDYPRADIHEILMPDILCDVIKGTFLDQNLQWLQKYLISQSGWAYVDQFVEELNRRIACVPQFPGLKLDQFPKSLNSDEWTADNAKELMKVFLPCLVNILPKQLILSFRHLFDFTYLIRRSVISDDTLDEIEQSLEAYQINREFFKSTSACNHFRYPQQHVLSHFTHFIQQFGAPIGLGSSFTESRHVEDARKSWFNSTGEFDSLHPIVLANKRIEKLSTLRQNFQEHVYFRTTSPDLNSENLADFDDLYVGDDDESSEFLSAPDIGEHVTFTPQSESGSSLYLSSLVDLLMLPELSKFVREFLFDRLCPKKANETYRSVSSGFFGIEYLHKNLTFNIFHSAKAIFYAPSDPSGINGMRSETIWCTSKWENEHARRDCVFVTADMIQPGTMEGFFVARTHLLFSMTFHNVSYDCALVHWYRKIQESPDETTGLYEVAPCYFKNGRPQMSVIPLHTIIRAAHLVPKFGEAFMAPFAGRPDPLNTYSTFIINKYVDQHAYEFLS